MKIKYCPRCEKELPIESFFKAPRQKDGFFCWCKECSKSYQLEHNKKTCIEKNLEKSQKREKNRKKHLGMEIESYRKWQKNLPGAIDELQWKATKQYFENSCAYCGESRHLQMDHFIPLYENGDFTINNIVPACAECNSTKGKKNPFKWYPRSKFYKKERMQKILKFLNYKDNKQQLKLVI